MNLPEFAQISEENELLRDQIGDLETALCEARMQINELKAQLEAKEEWTNAADLEAARAAMSSTEPRVSHAEVQSEWA